MIYLFTLSMGMALALHVHGQTEFRTDHILVQPEAGVTVLDDTGQSSSKCSNIDVLANYQITNATYDWIDPGGMTALVLGNDGVSPAQALPFVFRFYGLDYEQLYVGANGLFGFADENLSSATNTDLPNAAAPNNILCPFWDDLNPAEGGSVRMGSIGYLPNRKVVISWVAVPFNGATRADYSFQAVLEESTHRIFFQYKSVTTGRSQGDQGASATVGIENADGSVAAEYSYNGSTLLTNHTTLLFLPPSTTPSPGVLEVLPTGGLSAAGTVGGPFSLSLFTYVLTNSGGSSLDWAADKSQNWVSLSATNGTLAAGASDTLSVSINAEANSLSEGAYTDTVSLVNTTTGEGDTSRDVTLTVLSEGLLEVQPSEGLSAVGVVGGPFSPSSIVYTLTNAGGSAFDWTASKSQSWVSLSAATGTLAPGASDTLTVSINAEANSLTADSYSDTIGFTNVTSGIGDTSRGLTLTITREGLLEVLPGEGLSSSGLAGGPFSPSSIVYTLTNAGGVAFDWTASKSQGWVSLDSTSGALAPGASTIVTVSINAEANTLAVGSYSDTIGFTNVTSGIGDTSRSVTLTVASEGLLEVQPDEGLSVSGVLGGPFSPPTITYTLTNAGGSSFNWTASKSQSWVSLSATSGNLAAGASDSLVVSINAGADGLAAGIYTDTISFVNVAAGNGNTSRPVLLAVLSEIPGRLSWRWSNPMPHGANIVDVACTDGFCVQVAERGQIFTSTDMDYWTPRDSHTDRHLRGVTFLGGRIVISGESGTILFADDPSVFYLNDLGTTDWLESVAASTDLVVTVGDNGAVYTSTNAVSWIRKNIGTSTWLRSVAWGPPGFVAVGERGFIMSSQTGETWNQRTSGVVQHLNRVAWLGDRYWVAGDAGRVLTSVNGTSWSAQTTGATNYLYAAAGTTNIQLLAGEREVRLRDGGVWTDELRATKAFPPPAWSYYSSLWDGASFWLGGETGLWVQGYKTNEAGELLWYVPSSSLRSWLWAVLRTPHFYLAVGDRGTVMTSDNGIDWDVNLVPASVTNTIFLGVGESTNHYIAVGNAGAIIHSTNGVTWEAVEPRPTTNDLQGVTAADNLFLATGAKGTILASADGLSWTRQATPTLYFLSSVARFPGGWVAVGDRGTILTSIDGANWTSRSIATTNWFWQVRHLNGVLLLVGENGTLRTSANGTNWTARASGTTEWLTDATFIEGTWYVVGTGGAVLTSTNLTNWFNVGTLTRKALFGAAVSGGQLLAVGVEGIILRSQLVPDLTPIKFVSYAHTAEHNLFLFGGQPDQRFLLERSPDLTFWWPSLELEFTDGTGTLLLIEEVIPGLSQESYCGRLLP